MFFLHLSGIRSRYPYHAEAGRMTMYVRRQVEEGIYAPVESVPVVCIVENAGREDAREVGVQPT